MCCSVVLLLADGKRSMRAFGRVMERRHNMVSRNTGRNQLLCNALLGSIMLNPHFIILMSTCRIDPWIQSYQVPA